ncbi:hypothetical protein ACSYOL_003005, partial [Listeria monocytogenes]
KKKRLKLSFFLVTEMIFSPLHFSATIANSFQYQIQNNRPCHFFKSGKPRKFLHVSDGSKTSCQEGGKSVDRINFLNSFRFASVRHLSLTLPFIFPLAK